MKKSLIALAVAGAFAAPSAMADVTLSGAINMGLLYGKSNQGGATKTSLFPGYSNFNLTSVDDIGNGNRVMFNYQFNVENPHLPTAGAALTNRNSYLGIGGDWGAVKWGTNENVYERMMYSSDFMDGAFGPGGNLLILGTASSAGGASTVFEIDQNCSAAAPCMGFYRRSSHTVWYESPNWSGFSFEVDYTLSAYKTTTNDPKILSIGGKYQPEGMPFWVDAAYESHDDMFGVNAVTGQVGGTASSDTGFQIGGGYMFGDFTVGLRWERLTYEADGKGAGLINEWERDAFFINGKMNLPTGYAALQIGIADEGSCALAGGGACNAGTDTGATMIGVGYAHNLSRQSQVLVFYNQMDNDSAAQYIAIGGTNVAPGVDHRGLYLGIKHTF
ncbi:MAG: porin [Burkholderiales bacterium]